MKEFIRGKAYVVGDNIDTDQIIPAQHLVYSLTKPEERRLYGRFALSGLPEKEQGLPKGGTPFTAEDAFESEYSIIIAGSNFGCGSSREHAPFAIAEAGCHVVIAETYARIFYRNAVDGGFVIPFETTERLIEQIRTGDLLEVDTKRGILKNETTNEPWALRPLGEIKGIIEAGDIFEYAKENGLIGDHGL